MSELDRFLAARDFLLAHPTDLDEACAGFVWPKLEQFNWAIDYFDMVARDNDATALHILEESGAEARLSYRELSRRSSQVAAFLTGLGAVRGDRELRAQEKSRPASGPRNAREFLEESSR